MAKKCNNWGHPQSPMPRADPGFPVGWRRGGNPRLLGHRSLKWTLCGKNVCQNKRIGSSWGSGHPESFVCRSVTACKGQGSRSFRRQSTSTLNLTLTVETKRVEF